MRHASMICAAVSILAISLLAGCDDSSASSESTPSGSDSERILEDAQDGGAGSEQLGELEQAVADGSVSIEVAREATRRAVTCMSDAGLSATYLEQTDSAGITVPEYRVAIPDDQAEALMESCDAKEAFWINMLYQTQPSSVQAREDRVNQLEPALRACLEEKGFTTDPDAIGVDLANQALDVAVDSDWEIDCLAEAGVEGW